MSDDFAQRDSHLEALETLNREVGHHPAPKHQGGYLSQNEYATLIYYWAGEEHEPGLIDGVIATLANQSWAWTPDRMLQTAAAVFAFGELFPGKREGWHRDYPALYVACNRAGSLPASDAAWNQFHLIQWFILRRARKDEGIEIIDKLLDRVAEGGTVGYEAREWLHGIAYGAETWDGATLKKVEGCEPFKVALERTQLARKAMMVIG